MSIFRKSDGEAMTLGEFRRATAHLSDDILLYSGPGRDEYGGDYPISDVKMGAVLFDTAAFGTPIPDRFTELPDVLHVG